MNCNYNIWVHHIYQIKFVYFFYNNKVENKFGVRLTCISCSNSIVYCLEKEDNDDTRIGYNINEANCKILILIISMILVTRKGESVRRPVQE